ncbi:hypothetical protein Tco_0563930 [Tanacetum coccineum]
MKPFKLIKDQCDFEVNTTSVEVSTKVPEKIKEFRVLENLEAEATEFEVIKGNVHCEKMFKVNEAVDGENSRGDSFQVWEMMRTVIVTENLHVTIDVEDQCDFEVNTTSVEVSTKVPEKTKEFRGLENLEAEATEFEVIKVDVKRKYAEGNVHCEKMFKINEAIDGENSRGDSFQVWEMMRTIIVTENLREFTRRRTKQV